MGELISFPGMLKVCKCGWKLPLDAQCFARISDIDDDESTEHMKYECSVEFDCPECGRSYEVEFEQYEFINEG